MSEAGVSPSTSPAADSQSTPPGIRVVVTLVHGTILFARWPAVHRALGWLARALLRGDEEPPWFEAGSAFRVRLEADLRRLGCEPCRVESYPWSGGNTVWDRLLAAGDARTSGSRRPGAVALPTLRDHVAGVSMRFPGASQVLVGHSHGGNVCQYAITDRETRRAVSGLVCLSTPFVHARARRDSEVLTDALKILGMILYLTVFFGASVWVSARVPEPWDSIVFAVGFTPVLMAAALLWKLREHRREVQRAWAGSLSFPDEDVPPTFVLLSDGDEALLALKAAEGLGAVTRGLWSGASAFAHGCLAILKASTRAVVVAYAVAFVAALWWLVLNDAQSPWGGSPGQPWSLLFVAKLLVAAALVPAALLLALLAAAWLPALMTLLLGYPILWGLRWLAFGWGGSIGLDMTAESCPAGQATVVRLSAPPDTRGLRHVHICNDERTPGLIARFVMDEVHPCTPGSGPSS